MKEVIFFKNELQLYTSKLERGVTLEYDEREMAIIQALDLRRIEPSNIRSREWMTCNVKIKANS